MKNLTPDRSLWKRANCRSNIESPAVNGFEEKMGRGAAAKDARQSYETGGLPRCPQWLFYSAVPDN